ncbi:MAG TPA: hypothetical protein VK459_08850 [Polyangiaceae bacterium]|nr:hypothetical protein [Polyangiaceae bacterium]
MKRALCMPLRALLFTMLTMLTVLAPLVSIASLSACGGAKGGTEKELEALRTEIVKLRNETAMLGDRVGALERPSLKGTGQAAAIRAEDPERPPLEVVRLEPGSPRSPASSSASSPGGQAADEMALLGDAALAMEEEDDDAPRPVLRSAPGGAVIEEKALKGAPPSRTPKALGVARAAKVEVPR